MRYDWITSPLNRIGGLTFDALFRLQHFVKVENLDKEPDEETLVKKPLPTDEDFALLGISRETPWAETHKRYRLLMKERYSAVYNSLGSHEQTREVQKINDAFGRIRGFYIQKALQEQQGTSA